MRGEEALRITSQEQIDLLPTLTQLNLPGRNGSIPRGTSGSWRRLRGPKVRLCPDVPVKSDIFILGSIVAVYGTQVLWELSNIVFEFPHKKQ